MATTKHLRRRDARPIAISTCSAFFLVATSTTKAQTPQRLTDPDIGIVLNAWIDADGLPRGDAASFLDD